MVMIGDDIVRSSLEEYERSLIDRWNLDVLGPYENQWIAWQGEVVGYSDDLASLIEEFRDQQPLFAFVSFDVRA